MKRFNSVDVGVADMCLKNIARRFASMSLMVIMILIHFPVATVYMAGMDTVPSDGDYFISPDGDDSNPGTYEKPFRTIEKARDTIKHGIENGQSRDFVVYIRGGKYYRDTPLMFLPEHSGKDGFDIVYRNFPGETPEIIGGRVVSNWELHEAVGETIDVTVTVNSSAVNEADENHDVNLDISTVNKAEANQDNSNEKRSFFQRILDFFRKLFAWLGPSEASKKTSNETIDVSESSGTSEATETTEAKKTTETTVKVQPGIYKAYVDKDSEFNSLFENGRRAVLARTPNEGYALTQDADVSGSTTKIMYFEGDLPEQFDYSNA